MMNLWESYIQTDKMAGLILKNPNESNYETIKPWDSDNEIELYGAISRNNTEIWKWVICTKEDIGKIFSSYLVDWSIRPYSRRHWSLWRPKTKWIIRLQSNEQQLIQLNYCDWWGIIQKTLTTIKPWTIELICWSSKYNRKYLTLLSQKTEI